MLGGSVDKHLWSNRAVLPRVVPEMSSLDGPGMTGTNTEPLFDWMAATLHGFKMQLASF